METIAAPLTQRLTKCVQGLHFQVAERTLALWGSERFKRIMLEPSCRAVALRQLLPALLANTTQHWHESIRKSSGVVLEQYEGADPEGVRALREAGAAAEAGGAGAGAGAGGGGGGDSSAAAAGAGAGGSPQAAGAPPHASGSSSGQRSRVMSPPSGGGGGLLPVSDLIGGVTPKRQGAGKAKPFVPSLGGAGEE